MRHSNRILPLILALLGIAACTKTSDKGEDTPPKEEYSLPEVSETIVDGNTFNVEFFLKLDAPSYASSHILYFTGKKPLVYMYADVGYIPGKASALVETALLSKTYPFMVQYDATSEKGNLSTGILTRYSVSGFDGVILPEGLFMGGVNFNIPLASVVSMTFYSARISSGEQLKALATARHSTLYGDSVLVGEFVGEDPAEVKKFAESRNLGMRFDYVKAGERTVYTLVQPGFANRGFDVNGDCVTIRFEKFY